MTYKRKGRRGTIRQAKKVVGLSHHMSKDPTQRFGNRVADYIKYRPSYPADIIPFLRQEIKLTEEHEVADIGSGPGNSAKLFADQGNFVYGIEPNEDMYHALQQQMASYSNFSSRLAAAEDTSLEDQSVDIVVCGQSFHWFDLQKTKTEFQRILRPEGWVLLIWNTRRRDTSFGKAYEQLLLQYCEDYDQVDHSFTTTSEQFDYLYGRDNWHQKYFGNAQLFDFQSLRGRLMSSSYAPTTDNPHFDELMTKLRALFDEHQKDGKLAFKYKTELIYGRL